MINIMNCDCMTFMRGLPDKDAVARYERHAAQTQLFNGDLGYTYTNGAEGAQQAELPIEEIN